MPPSPPPLPGRSGASLPMPMRSSPSREPRVSSYLSAVSSRYLASPPSPQPATVSTSARASQPRTAGVMPKVAPKASTSIRSRVPCGVHPAALPIKAASAETPMSRVDNIGSLGGQKEKDEHRPETQGERKNDATGKTESERVN